MAINRISGNILQADLVRGTDLAFQGNLLYINVQDRQVGINTAVTTHTLTVQGDVNISRTVFVNAVAATATVSSDEVTANTLLVGNANIGNILGDNLSVNSMTATSFARGGNIILSNNLVSTSTPNDLTLTPTGNNLLIVGTAAGIVLPLGNTSQRPNPASTATVRFNSDTARLEVYDGISWQSITTQVTNQTVIGDGSTVNFVLDRDSTTAAVLISINGVLQLPNTAYTVAGNILTLSDAPLSTDIVDVRFL
jgi:hypothetical protein